MKKMKIFSSILTSSVALSSLIGFGFTYSWIKREFAPEFSGTELKVETSGSLAIKLYGSPTSYSVVDLNQVLGLSDFTLKQVSSATGKSDDFFGVQYDGSSGRSTLEYLVAPNEDYTLLAKTKGYIETKFLLTCTTAQNDYSSKFIFLDGSSDACYIEFPEGQGLVNGKDVRESIRVSITPDGLDKHYLFRKNAYMKDSDGNILYDEDGNPIKKVHTGANPTIENGIRVANGKSIYGESGEWDPRWYQENSNCYEFSDFDGGIIDADSSFNPNKTLFSMGEGSRWVTLRIWLEGYDENTVDVIAGCKVNVKLTFRMNSDVE